MPIIAHTDLPAFARLASEGVPVTSPVDWWGPVLQVGLLNTMADGALEATERQFLRLLAAAIPDRGVLLHVFGLPEIPRQATARRHCDTHYASFAEVRAARLDALIVTGANISEPDLGREQVESEIFGVSKRVDPIAAININWELYGSRVW